MEHNAGAAGAHAGREHYTPRRVQFLLGHLRELVAEILARPVIPADLVISRFFASRRYLGSHDRGFISDAAYAILRGVLRYRALLGAEMSGDADRAAALAVTAYVIESAQVMDAVAVEGTLGLRAGDLARVARALAEGRSRAAELPLPERTTIAVGMPAWFVRSVLEECGEDEGARLLEALDRQAPITLRANTLVTDRDKLIAALDARGIPAVPGAYAPEAVILERRMNAHSIPEFRAGWFELQDEGSQLLGRLLDPRPNWRVFDACAGAGGKTLHLAALMRGRGELVAHDVNSRRLSEIRPRLKRSGVQNVRVMEHELYNERRERLAGTFHALLIDAPCSGTGVLRRNPGARLTLEPELVERIAVEQETILEEYASLVRPGGLMLYATCSVLRRENEEQVLAFLRKHEEWRLETPQVPESMLTAEGMFRCAPHLHGTDGFFGALLRRGT
jgi:16S rRNA (cytosine967-C5)-methyltransferase